MPTLWLDDVRDPRNFGMVNAKWVTTVDDCKREWLTGRYTHLSLDHDLGICDECRGGETDEEWLIRSKGQSMPHCPHVGTGMDFIEWLEEEEVNGNDLWPPHRGLIEVHSANPVGRARMLGAIDRHYFGDLGGG